MENASRVWNSYCGLICGISRKLYTVAGACLVLMIVPVLVDIGMRSLFGKSLLGSIELEELLMMMVVFLGLAQIQTDENHINVDLLFGALPPVAQRFLSIFNWNISFVIVLLMAYEIFQVGLEKMGHGEVTVDLALPLGPFFIVAGLGLIVLLLAIVRSLGNALADAVRNRDRAGLVLGFCLPALLCLLPWLLADTPLAWEYLQTGILAFLLLMALLMLKLPIGFCMAFVGLLGLMTININPWQALDMLGIGMPHTAMNYTMAVIPMFILMGEVALYAGISKDLFNAAAKWMGHLPGGLAIASVTGCAGFAAICGDSLATAMTMSSVALPEMKARGYNPGLACATLASGGTLGILIPPSIGFIFYAIVSEVSLGRLFLAGVIPGVILATVFCLMLYVLARMHPDLMPRGAQYTMKEKLASLPGILPMIGLVVLVLGGILIGFFSPTEGGAVGAAGAIVYAVAGHRLTWKNFFRACASTVSMTTKLMLILMGVNIFGYFLASTRLPFELADLMLGLTSNRYLILALVIALYVALGCMLNVVPMILLTLPSIYPTILACGFDPVWFGVITVLLMEMGQITPPMGLVVFAIAGMPDGAPMSSIFRYVILFVLCMLAVCLLLTIFPSIALFLPNALI